MKIIEFLYRWLIFFPILIVTTIITALCVILGCSLGGNKFWGYVPPRIWSKIICRSSLCQINVKSNFKLDPNQSYIFVANHQSAFDIFLIYGYLNQNIKWVQKHELRKIPFVGKASEIAGHVFVDTSSVKAMIQTIEKAEKELADGVSMVIFPEGARAVDGKISRFKKGAFIIATQMNLPIVPLTLNGPYDVLKRGSRIVHFWKKMELIIHDPIPTDRLGESDITELMHRTYDTIAADLWDKYK